MGAYTLTLRFSGNAKSQVPLVRATIQPGAKLEPLEWSSSCGRGDTLENEAHALAAKHLKGACTCHPDTSTRIWDLDAILRFWR